MPAEPSLTDTQRRILTALCRPCVGESRFTTPATNQEIAAEVFLSVDAVKAHLRTLFRKFGVEELPHNQKRARLVELVLEGGYLSEGELGSEPTPGRRAGGGPGRRRVLAGAGAALAAALGGLVIAGVISGGSDEAPADAPSKADFVRAVNGYCRLALAGAKVPADASQVDQAGAYLRVIETMRGRLDSLTPPEAADPRLERFRAGLQRAADYTSKVAESPPPPNSRAGADIVAELTIAAGQVQAGALGYGLGSDCSAIGDVVAGSARNAAGGL
jgi:DNA-binding CsgD family transcriptional regulator